MKEASLNRFHAVWVQLHDILEKAEVLRQYIDHRHREHTLARNSERVCGGGQTGRVWGTFVQTQNMFNTIGGPSVSYELYLMTYQHWFTNDNKSALCFRK